MVRPSCFKILCRPDIPGVRVDGALEDIDHIGCRASEMLFDVPDSLVPRGLKGAGVGGMETGVASFGRTRKVARLVVRSVLDNTLWDCRFTYFSQVILRLSAAIIVLLGNISLLWGLVYRMIMFFLIVSLSYLVTHATFFSFFLFALRDNITSVLVCPFLQYSFSLLIVPPCHGEVSCIFFKRYINQSIYIYIYTHTHVDKTKDKTTIRLGDS